MAYDDDIGENAEMEYSIEDDDSKIFDIIIDNDTQEGIVILKKVQTFKLFTSMSSAKSKQKYIIIHGYWLYFASLIV
jgi:hypothetical protein